MSNNLNTIIAPTQDSSANSNSISSREFSSSHDGGIGSSTIFAHLSNVVQRISKHNFTDSSSNNLSASEKSNAFLSNFSLADRMLGGAVTMGASVALFQLSIFIVKSAYLIIRRHVLEEERRLTYEDVRGKKQRSNGNGKSSEGRYRWFHYILPVFLAEAMIEQTRTDKNKVFYDNDESDYSTIESDYKKPDSYFKAQFQQREAIPANAFSNKPVCWENLSGSCHCRSVQFQLKRVPLHVSDEHAEVCFVAAHDSPGKIRYPKVPAAASCQLEVAPCSVEYLRTYHSTVPGAGTADLTAYAFCSVCGVHIFFAPNSKFDYVEVNGNCLDMSDFPRYGKRVPSLRVSWHQPDEANSDGKVEIEWKPRPKSDSISTNLTEETTATLNSASYDYLCYPRVQHDYSWRGLLHSSTPRSLDQYEYLRHSPEEMKMREDDSSRFGEPQSTSVSPFSMHRAISSGSSTVSDIKTGQHFSTSSAVSSSASRRKKSGGISVSDKRNLVHYMKRHLASPREVDEEVLTKEV